LYHSPYLQHYGFDIRFLGRQYAAPAGFILIRADVDIRPCGLIDIRL